MLQHYNRVVTTKLMVMLKHNVSMVTPSQHAPSFERLVSYIDRNIKLELTAEQLAQYAGLSLRSLYMLFEKNARTTPKNFVRQKKLEQVHAILTNPVQCCPNVTAVALEYGFTTWDASRSSTSRPMASCLRSRSAVASPELPHARNHPWNDAPSTP
ncbi:AraC family transcriptional regulator [Thauera humireducens]|uniref:AraC family transcriptional regulator n=1 Tax=Thauera humireducens TaxID=1134435 RepID=UPI00312036DA